MLYSYRSPEDWAILTLAWMFDLTVGTWANGDYIEGGEQDGINSRT